MQRFNYDPNEALVLAKTLWDWEPHSDGQRDWILDTANTKVAACGRRWGKSVSIAIDLLCYALLCEGSIQYVYAPSVDQTRPIFAENICVLAEEAYRKFPADIPKPKIRKSPQQDISFEFPNGKVSRIYARSLGESTGGSRLRGFAAHRVVVDEAARCPDKVIDNAVRPQLADVGGQMILISSPFGKNFFYRKWLEAGGKHHFPSTMNPYLPAEWLEKEKQALGETSETWRSEYLAEFVDTQGAVFNYDQLERAMRPPRSKPLNSYAPEEGRRYVAGVDLANVEDFTVVAVLDCTEPEFVLVDFDRFHKLPDWGSVFARIEARLKRWDAMAFVDSSSMSDSHVEELRRRGCKVDGYSFNHYDAKRDLVSNLVRKLDKNQIVLPDISTEEGRLIDDELRHYYYKKNEGGRTVYGGAPGKHDDIVIALMLAAWRFKVWEPKEVKQEITLEESIRLMLQRGYASASSQRKGRRRGKFIRR